MSLAAIGSIGAIAQGASAGGSVVSSTSAKFAGLLRKRLKVAQLASSSEASRWSRNLKMPDGSAVRVKELTASAQNDLNQISAKLTSLLKENGLDAPNGVTLQVDSSGNAKVLEPPAGKAAIQSIISGNPGLQSLLASVAQKERVIQAAAQANGTGNTAQQSFQAALAKLSDPQTALTLLVGPLGTQTSFGPALS